MRSLLEKFFHLQGSNTTVRTEVIGGLTTFMTMAYIIFVNPAMISQTGIDFGSVVMATGIAFGFIAYAALKFFTGRGKEVSWLVYALAVLFILRFVYLKAI